MILLTAAQSNVLKYINDFMIENRYPAITTDIADYFHVTYKTAMGNVQALQRKGYIDVIHRGRLVRALFPLYKE
jgi:Mn-dependent DtxR family transcriptional regulator